MTVDVLKPCPFCGGEAAILQNREYDYVECGNPSCLVRPATAEYTLTQLAVNAWNTRHYAAAPDAADVERVANALHTFFEQHKRFNAGEMAEIAIAALAAMQPRLGED